MKSPTVSSVRRQYDRANLKAARIVLGPLEHPCTGLVLWAQSFMARLERDLAKAKARRSTSTSRQLAQDETGTAG